MSTNLWTFILSLATFADSPSAQSIIHKLVRVGSTAVLPCDLRNISSTQLSSRSPHIVWYSHAEIVFERLGQEMYEAPGYEGRLDVPEDKLLEGDCSLMLRNFTLNDEGLYQSFLRVTRMKRSIHTERVLIQTVELSVDDAPEESHNDDKAGSHGNQQKNSPKNKSRKAMKTHTCITTLILLNLLSSVL